MKKSVKDKQRRRGVMDLPKAIEERLDEGRAERESVPLEAHGEWAAPADRPDPVGVLEQEDATRVPELVPIRHGRMIVSPFTFYRGGAAIMAWDLSRTPTTGLRVQCCGDAHLSNFGVFAAPDRRIVFDLNDFDETLPAPFEWDVKRLVASFVVAARNNGHRPKEQRAAARAAAAAYRTTMAEAARMRFLDVWYARIDADTLLAELTAADGQERAEDAGEGAHADQPRLAGEVRAARRRRLPDQAAAAADRAPARGRATATSSRSSARDSRTTRTRLAPDRRVVLDHYHYEDFARKVVGVGSVGTEAFMILLVGDRDDDPLFLQIKEASASVLAPYAGASEYEHQGERVVQGQRLMQSASDAFLGWVTGTGKGHREFYVRQLRDMKGSAAIETMTPDAPGALRPALRHPARRRARPHRQRREDRRLPRRRRHVRPRHTTLRGRLRRPDRARLRRVHARRRRAAHRGRSRRVTGMFAPVVRSRWSG